ncbi:sensor domain-containing diguanylate cyclase [Photobacterium nomapromontoriensis]|uniref:sensor domain-containing diguanylate cyclase n=1 Tax=Photobacterium nomapromontoriensis TaxID=2910237 RepID=UPI003D0D2B91
MSTHKSDALRSLAGQLAKQADMERWCHCLLTTLKNELRLDTITVMVEQDGGTQVVANWLKRDFTYFPIPKRLEEYSGVPTGLYQQAKRSGQFVRVLMEKQDMPIWAERESQCCQLLLPISMHHRRVGFIYAETTHPDYFEHCVSEVEELLTLLASDIHARILQQEVLDHHLTRCSVEAELEVRNYSITQYLELLKKLHEVTLELSKASNLDQLYRNAVMLGRQYLGIDRMAIFLTDFEKNEMRGTFGTDPDGQLVSRHAFSSAIPDHPLVHEAMSRKDHVVVKDNVPLYFGTKQVGLGWNAMIAMWNGDNCIGWVAADNLINQRILTEHQKEILKLFGAALGQQIVIRRHHDTLTQLNLDLEERVNERTKELLVTNKALAEANQQLELWSMQDGLTGISNRRFFDHSLQSYWLSAYQNAAPISLIMIDVDYFKSFNDQHGHQEGDACLKKIAITLEEIAKLHEMAILSRYGGEEFVCIIPNLTEEAIHVVGQTMIDAVAELAFPSRNSEFGVVTVSLGCCTMIPSVDNRWECLLERADVALYQAKEFGRNRLVQNIQQNHVIEDQ